MNDAVSHSQFEFRPPGPILGTPPSQGNNQAPGSCLLEGIRDIQFSVGEGLNEDELTRLLQCSGLPREAGFTFLSLCKGVVTLAVPHQDLARWYPAKGWITAEKEQIARSIADKYGWSVCEPPDAPPSSYWECLPDSAIHHHLELTQGPDTIIVAHPHYLKICLCIPLPSHGLSPNGQRVWLGPDLLNDLSALYQT